MQTQDYTSMSNRSEQVVLALIPARSGSKSIPHKNIKEVGGKPLLAWSIEHARSARSVSRIVVSTDSEEYAQIARDFGAETPFLRPTEYARDDSTDLEVFQHALQWLKESEGYEPDICVHLRPTCPVRSVGMIDEIVDILASNPTLHSVRTVTEVLHPPFKMWYREADGLLKPVAPLDEVSEPWNRPRQVLPTTYLQTANVDAVRTRVITQNHSMTGSRIWGYLEACFHDIDTEDELRRAEKALRLSGANANEGGGSPKERTRKTFCFDIDGVIATITPGNDYRLAAPRRDTITHINRLYDAGHEIILFTARGSATGIDWSDVTKEQMKRWGVRYHHLRFGKPAADVYVDDRMVALDELEELTRMG